MKRRRNNAAEAKKIVGLLCAEANEQVHEQNLNSAAELIVTLYGKDVEYEVMPARDRPYGSADNEIVFTFNAKREADRFLDWVLKYFKANNDLIVHYTDLIKQFGQVQVRLICPDVVYKERSSLRTSAGEAYTSKDRRKNPKRRRNSAAEAKKVVDLICSNVGKPSDSRGLYPNEPNLNMAAELIQALYGQSIEYDIADWGTQNYIAFRFFMPQFSPSCPDAERFLDWVLTYFKADNRLYVHYDDFSMIHFDPAEFEVKLTCVKPKYKGGALENHIKRLKSRRKNPKRRRNSGQYARQLAELICSKNRDSLKQVAELIMTFHDTDWDKTQLRFGGSNDSIRWRFYHDKTEATKLYKFLGQYFASEKRISVYLQESLQSRSYNVIIDCQKSSRSKYFYISKMKEGKESKGQKVQAQNIFNPKRRRNTAYPKLEQLLCDPNTDTETLIQAAEMILALVDFSDLLLPKDQTYEAIDIHGKVHEFYHEENPYVAKYAPSYGSFGVRIGGYQEIIFQLKEIRNLVYQNVYGSAAAFAIAYSIASMLPNTEVYLLDGVGPPTIYVYCPSPAPASQIRRRRNFSKMFHGGSFKRIR